MAEGRCDPIAYNTSSWEEERRPDRMSTMYQRKRPASREEDAFRSENCPSLATEGEGDKSLAAKTLAVVPIEVLDTVFEVPSFLKQVKREGKRLLRAARYSKYLSGAISGFVMYRPFYFLDGNGLLSCERVSYRWRLATDRTHLWKRACLAAFPHLGDYYFDSAYLCCSAYEGNWRETFLDANRENRSAVLDWNMEAVADAAGDPEESERRYFPPFSLCGYSFSLLADPGGNPRAIIQEQAAGAPRVEKGLSVYLTVAFPEELPDAPPWGGLGVGFQQPYRSPPLPLGPCHPWGASEEEHDGTNISNCHGGKKGCEVVAEMPRDPHGLRRRRRRFRRREGREKSVSHAGDPEVIARECCAAFSLAAVNKAGRKDIMWMSSMEGDRFYPGRNSWGVHCLLPTSVIQDPEEGFLQDGSLTVRLRVRLLFLIAHVYMTADLASHRGFGVVPVRGKEQSFHYTGDAREAEGNGGGNPRSPGPLSCLTFEVLRCTTLADMELLVAQALNLASTQDLRLWVISQPLTDGPLAPRQLLSGEDAPSNLLDGGQDSPSLFRLLPVDTLDETCRVRLWAEQRSDAGFWEAEMSHPRWQMPVVYADGTIRPVPRPASREVFAGVRLACSSDTPPWCMHSRLAWGSAGHQNDMPNAVMAEASGSGPDQAHEASALSALSAEENGGGTAVGSLDVEDSTDNHPPREKRMLVFLKTLGLREGGRNGGDGEKPAYLTHVVLRGRSSLRSLFELVVDLLRDGTAPEELGVYIEDLPCAWQGRTTGGMSVRSERNRSMAGSYSGDSPNGAPGAGRRKAPKTPPSKQFFTCPPPHPAMDPSQHPFVPWTAEFVTKSNNEFNARENDGRMTAYPPSAEAYVRTNCVKFGRGQPLTLEGAGVTSGASLCFFRAGGEGGRQGKGETMVRSVYTAMASELVEDMRKLLRGEGPLGRVHLIKLHEVVEMCESLGYQGFRARITHDQQRHVNARETLEYVAKGRHLAFICDSCGTQDFTGPRYHCLQCPDYDLCRNCYDRVEPVPPHRYIFTDGHWKREGGFHEHTDLHDLEEIWSVPAEGCDWHRWQY